MLLAATRPFSDFVLPYTAAQRIEHHSGIS
jgi:hypothetical protein